MFSKLLLAGSSLVVATLLLLWPAIYNHQPFFFPDTTAYARGADAAVIKLTGVSSVWTKQSEAQSVDGVVPDKAVLAGRSIYYGALVYLGERVAGEWSSIAIQALLVVLALYAMLRIFELQDWRYLMVLVAALAAFTALPLYASFLMPDIFTGLAILACALLLTTDFKNDHGQSAAWFVLLTAALTFHTTHAILAALMFGLGLALYLFKRSLVMPRGLAVIGIALGVAWLFGTAFTIGVTKSLGEPPLTPPFLMARLIDDGPGYDYLRDTCPASGFVACRFIDRLPLQSDDFLWSKDLQSGVFGVSDPVIRRALSREQYRFALAVIAHEPGMQMAVSLRNAAEQLFLLKATEFSYTPEEKDSFAVKLPTRYFLAMQSTPAYTGHLPLLTLAALSYASTAVGVGLLAFYWYSGRSGEARHTQRLKRLMSWVAFGVFANAAVCGVMSGPHDRYQARVAWLIPAVALLANFQINRTWWDKRLKCRVTSMLR